MAISPITLATRFGYGVRLGAGLPTSATEVLSLLNKPDPLDKQYIRPTMQQRITLFGKLQAARKGERDGMRGAEDETKAVRREVQMWIGEDIKIFLVRAVFSEQGFRERLVAFWADHFTVSGQNLQRRLAIGAYLDEAIRPNINGQFVDILKAVVMHPALLIYLDQVISVGPNSYLGQERGRGLNENLAREILELHTLGVGGGYSQTDVRQFAELLTGLMVGKNGTKFEALAAEPLQVQILGKTYRHENPQLQDIMDFLDDLAVHPETARHIATKLAVHFVSENPDPDMVNAMTRTFQQTNGDLHAIYKVMLEHPASSVVSRQKVKLPMELVVSAIRALGIGEVLKAATVKEFRDAVYFPMQAMGQELFQPQGPDGWSEEGGDWITPPTLTARIEWIVELAEEYGQDLDPRELLSEVLGAVSPELQIAVIGAETKWEGVALMLASPEFNRR